MKVEGGATLTLVNLHLNNVAYRSSYVPTATQPYRVDGVGTGLWPSVQMGPGSKVGHVPETASAHSWLCASAASTCSYYELR